MYAEADVVEKQKPAMRTVVGSHLSLHSQDTSTSHTCEVTPTAQSALGGTKAVRCKPASRRHSLLARFRSTQHGSRNRIKDEAPVVLQFMRPIIAAQALERIKHFLTHRGEVLRPRATLDRGLPGVHQRGFQNRVMREVLHDLLKRRKQPFVEVGLVRKKRSCIRVLLGQLPQHLCHKCRTARPHPIQAFPNSSHAWTFHGSDIDQRLARVICCTRFTKNVWSRNRLRNQFQSAHPADQCGSHG